MVGAVGGGDVLDLDTRNDGWRGEIKLDSLYRSIRATKTCTSVEQTNLQQTNLTCCARCYYMLYPLLLHTAYH